MPASASPICKRRATEDQYSTPFLQVHRIESRPVFLFSCRELCCLPAALWAGSEQENRDRELSCCGNICVPVRKGISQAPFPFLKALLIPLPHPDPQPSHSLRCNSSGAGAMKGRFFRDDHTPSTLLPSLVPGQCVSLFGQHARKL